VDVFADPSIRPDELKFYPTAVIPNTELYELYRSGEYKALEISDIKDLVKNVFVNIIPPYTRIKRLIRDIPATEIAAGSDITNLSQLTHMELAEELKHDKEKRQTLYTRLYPHARSYDDHESLLEGFKEQCNDNNTITHIYG
jgi:histone acetyltransferase (RNA polymerase elongator complex component)